MDSIRVGPNEKISISKKPTRIEIINHTGEEIILGEGRNTLSDYILESSLQDNGFTLKIFISKK